MNTTDVLLQSALQTLIQIMVPVLIGAAIAVAKHYIDEIKSRMSQDQYIFAGELARQVVLAAEQNGLRGAIENEATVKKAWALERLEASLVGKGIHLDLDKLDDLIESAVFEAFKW
jgi:hypothetical protein